MAVLSYCSPAFGWGTIHNQIGITTYNFMHIPLTETISAVSASGLCEMIYVFYYKGITQKFSALSEKARRTTARSG